MWLNAHQDHVQHMNGSILDEVPEETRLCERAPKCPQLINAFIKWQHAISAAKAEVAPWQSLSGIILRIENLARYWWTLAFDDPLFRNPDLGARAERARAFSQTNRAIAEFEQVIKDRDLGANRVRQLLIKMFLGPKVIRSIDRMNSQV